jgi:pantothenate kinase
MTTFRSVAEVVETVRSLPRTGRRCIVGIVGAPGAGKSTIAAAVVDALGPSGALLPMDGFHLAQARLIELGRRDRMGAPDTFDVAALLRVLEALTLPASDPSIAVTAPGFDRTIEEPIADAITIRSDVPIVIVEGNYLLLDDGAWASVAGYLEVSFFVDVDHDRRIERLIARHERFGKDVASATAWALGSDEANARVVETTARLADHVIELGPAE